MATKKCVTLDSKDVKATLNELAREAISALVGMIDRRASARAIEQKALELGQNFGRLILEIGLSARNRQAMLDDLEKRGLDASQVQVRLDPSYWMVLMTLFGRLQIPMFSYRDLSTPAPVTRSPARELFPLYPRCRSTEPCLEWESRLAGQHPFRKAQESLAYFTHNAVMLEDTTIERHAVSIGHLIEQQWLYRSRGDIEKILREDATRDQLTGQPILYWSSDAHALRRYINESWTAEWKMMNGLRLWCECRRTGRIIHVGGEFTCGDAGYLAARMRSLVESNIVPADGDFGGGLVAQYVFVADGMPWFEERLLKLLPNAIAILDVFHLMQRLSAHTNTFKGVWNPNAFYERALRLLIGKKPKRNEPVSARKGHTKQSPHEPDATERGRVTSYERCHRLIKELKALIMEPQFASNERDSLLAYIESNAYRMAYKHYRSRGFQIGSGAMESFHRTGSQERLKRPGARWLPETLEGMFRLRMLEIIGRWKEWWAQSGFFADNADRFTIPTYRTRTGPTAPACVA